MENSNPPPKPLLHQYELTRSYKTSFEKAYRQLLNRPTASSGEISRYMQTNSLVVTMDQVPWFKGYIPIYSLEASSREWYLYTDDQRHTVLAKLMPNEEAYFRVSQESTPPSSTESEQSAVAPQQQQLQAPHFTEPEGLIRVRGPAPGDAMESALS